MKTTMDDLPSYDELKAMERRLSSQAFDLELKRPWATMRDDLSDASFILRDEQQRSGPLRLVAEMEICGSGDDAVVRFRPPAWRLRLNAHYVGKYGGDRGRVVVRKVEAVVLQWMQKFDSN